MELLGVWDLGYLAWTKATDLTKHGEFLSWKDNFLPVWTHPCMSGFCQSLGSA